MQISTVVELDDKMLRAALHSVMENYPEVSTPSLQCVKWRYDECSYTFDEIDDDGDIEATHYVTLEKLVEGFEKMMKNPPRCIPPVPVKQTAEEWDAWCCNMDADGIDCLLQYTLFGELIYG